MALKAQGKSQHEAGQEATFPTRSLTTLSGIVNISHTRPLDTPACLVLQPEIVTLLVRAHSGRVGGRGSQC
jgi:hypothetical protein